VFDLDTFIADCETARDDTEPRLAVRDLLQRALDRPAAIADVLPPKRGGISLLHHTPQLTIINVVWAPGMKLFAHDHRMWAVIGVYTGREDNEFFRRSADGSGLVASNGKTLDPGVVAVLGDDTVHAVSNPLRQPTGAIHVYGGDFVNQPRSQWRPPDLVETPYDSAVVERAFADANAAWDARRDA
jgi:predicted metal-dependent enzyme (double-stranded beta helix superfamily)